MKFKFNFRVNLFFLSKVSYVIRVHYSRVSYSEKTRQVDKIEELKIKIGKRFGKIIFVGITALVRRSFVDRMSWHLLISDKSMDLIACTEIGAGD